MARYAYRRISEIKVANVVSERRQMWTDLLVGLITEICADGCRRHSAEAIDALCVLIRYATKDIQKYEQAEKRLYTGIPEWAIPGVLGIAPSPIEE